MLQITHRQARRIIQRRMAGITLPDEQWTALYAHLESCPECRAYQKHQQMLELCLRRGLRARWSGIPEPGPAVVQEVVRARAKKFSLQQLGARVGGYMVIALVVVLLISGLILKPDPPPPGTPTARPTHTAAPPTPTVNPKKLSERFKSVILFESRRDGNAEIYLLNSVEGGQVTGDQNTPANLTNHPANDTFPIWSPDGEWIAFLSDRTGKSEVFVMHVAGSQLTQVTDAPNIDWQGPLSWSADGRFLAANGARSTWEGSDGSQPVTRAHPYLIPLDASEQAAGLPILAGYSRNAGTPKFSPSRPLLAYEYIESEDIGNVTMQVFDLESGQTKGLSYGFMPETETVIHAGDGGRFDWSPDGARLAYIYEGPFDLETGLPEKEAISNIRTTLEIRSESIIAYAPVDSQPVIRSDKAGAFSAVTWAPDGKHLVYLAESESSPGCWTVHMRLNTIRKAGTQEITGLCVDGNLSRSNWTPDGIWLVVEGHLPGQDEPGLWAVRPDWQGTKKPQQEPIPLLPGEWLAEDQPLLAQVRPSATSLKLDPQPMPSAAQLPVSRPAGPLPPLLFAAPDRTGSSISMLEPFSGERTRLLASRDQLSCPVLSPDRQRIAYLPTWQNETEYRSEVWVMDADGKNARQLAKPPERYTADTKPPYDYNIFECPLTWSPDGKTLSVILYRTMETSVALIPVDGGHARFIILSTYAVPYSLHWSPDGSQVLLTYVYSEGEPPRLVAIDPLTAGENDIGDRMTTLIKGDNWNVISGLDFSPSGNWLAWIISEVPDVQHSSAELRISRPDGTQQRLLTEFPVETGSSLSNLRWLTSERLGFIETNWANQRNPYLATVWLYNQNQARLEPLVRLDENLYASAWSPDGRWLAYSTESGLWLLDVENAHEAAPLFLGGPPPTWLEWSKE